METKKNTSECLDCYEPIVEVSPNIWALAEEADKGYGDPTLCDVDVPHKPIPEEIECGQCGTTIPFTRNEEDQYCERCIREFEEEERHRNWCYYNA